MNAAHYHLIINHIPIFSTLFGLLILIWGWIKASRSIKNIAFALLIIGGISSYAALKTGHEAEHTLKQQSFFNHEMHERIEAHEHTAEDAFWITIVVGVLSIIGLFAPRFGRRAEKMVDGLVLLACTVSLGYLIYTADLGGAIRHTEAYSDNITFLGLLSSAEESKIARRADTFIEVSAKQWVIVRAMPSI